MRPMVTLVEDGGRNKTYESQWSVREPDGEKGYHMLHRMPDRGVLGFDLSQWNCACRRGHHGDLISGKRDYSRISRNGRGGAVRIGGESCFRTNVPHFDFDCT